MANGQVIIQGRDDNDSRYQIYVSILHTRDVLKFLAESVGERGNAEQDEFAAGLEQVLLDQVARLDACMESDELGAWSMPLRQEA